MTTDLFGLLPASDAILSEWRVEVTAAGRHFFDLCVSLLTSLLVCWRKTAHLRQKMTWYCLTPLNEKRNRSLITPTLQYLSAHPKPLHGSQSQTVTWALKLTQSSPLSLFLSHSLSTSPTPQEDRLSKSEGSPSHCRLRGFGVPIHRK